MKKFLPVKFDKLTRTDSNSFVWTGLIFNPKQMAAIENYLKEHHFLPPTAKIINMQKIVGNVLGDKGRTDVLFTTTMTTFNPIARLVVGVTWTSDFIDNYGKDYH